MKLFSKVLSLSALCLAALNSSVVFAEDSNSPKASDIGSYTKEGIDVVQGRLFRKALRSEISLDMGMIIDNQFLTYQLIQPRYTFHLRESIGIELTFGKAIHQERQILEALKNVDCENPSSTGPATIPCSVELDPGPDPIKNMYFANIVWSPIYGKLALFSKKIYHFDVYALAGGGMFDNERSNRFGFNVGLGSKVFINDWMSVRLDFRNITVREGEPFNQIINNRIYSLGVSAFLPTKPRKNT